MTLVTVWLIQLVDVLQPLFIALGIYFVLKPGADYLSCLLYTSDAADD